MRRFIPLIHAAVFLLVVLATMEAASRIDDHVTRGAPLSGSYDFERLFVFDGKVVRGMPNSRYAKWALNSLGMRGPEPATGMDIPRVVVYGASEAFGIYETDGKEFPRVLEDRLRIELGEPRLEVLNAGVPGMRVGSGTEYIGWLGERFRPRVVLLYPTPTHYIGITRPLCGRPARPASQAQDDLRPTSRLLAKLTDRVKENLPQPMLTLARKAAIAWATRHNETLSIVDEASVRALAADLKCALMAVRAIGAIPVLVTHANRFGPTTAPDDAAWLTGWRMQYPELREGGFLDLERRANDVIRSLASEQGVLLIDAGSKLAGQPELFADHAHFTDAGSQKMGSLIAREVAPLLRPGS
jgi:hypothetical protein